MLRSLTVFLGLTFAAWAQTTPPASTTSQQDTEPADRGRSGWRRISPGFRVQGFVFEPFVSNPYQLATTSPTTLTQSFTSPVTSRVGIGFSLEVQVTSKFAVAAEFLRSRAGYTRDTDFYTGVDISTTAEDDRKLTSSTETTKYVRWDAPLMLRYIGLTEEGAFSHVYIGGGAIYRTVSNITTKTDITDPVGNTTSNTDAAHPTKRGTWGGVVGFGVRFIDDFGFKLTPEVRYIRWMDRKLGRSLHALAWRRSRRHHRSHLLRGNQRTCTGTDTSAPSARSAHEIAVSPLARGQPGPSPRSPHPAYSKSPNSYPRNDDALTTNFGAISTFLGASSRNCSSINCAAPSPIRAVF